MNALILIFATFAQAHTLSCVGPGLSYAIFRPDGGPSIAPTEQLLLSRQLLIQVNPLENRDVREANFELTGARHLLGKPVRHDRYYLITRFEQDAGVVRGDSGVFAGQVICREETYDGPPIP